ncbi:putative thiolase [Rosa chinensis]|uniref:Putative thiolase n=1 Tax=Rosa chinensis TaxID=74649 RepID=A0A2P6PSK0_ROSCH|nr:putative thiolase [Rosa chinensis]
MRNLFNILQSIYFDNVYTFPVLNIALKIMLNRAYRTAIYKAKRGGFKDTLVDDLLAPVLKVVIERTNLNPSEVGDIVVGTVLAPGSLRAIECRMAAFYVGFPDIVPIRTVNMQC